MSRDVTKSRRSVGMPLDGTFDSQRKKGLAEGPMERKEEKPVQTPGKKIAREGSGPSKAEIPRKGG